MYKTKLLNDDEIYERITQALEGTDFTLVSFERYHEHFGNMIAVIKSSKKKYTFITDRDDIFCNKELIMPHGYHVAGEDETPINLIKIINQTVQAYSLQQKSPKLRFEEDIDIPVPKDEVISAIEGKNQTWYRQMYTNQSGIICEHRNNPVRQDTFIVYYYSEPITVGPGLSSVIETYPIIVHLTGNEEHTAINIKIIRKKIALAAFIIMLVIASGFVIVPLFVPSAYLGGHFFQGLFLLTGLFGIFMLLKYYWTNKPKDVMPGVDLLKEVFQGLENR